MYLYQKKRVLDAAMTLGLLTCFGYSFTGAGLHELIGVSLLAAIAGHLVMGRYGFRRSPAIARRFDRKLSVFLYALMLFALTGICVSSLMLSTCLPEGILPSIPAMVTPHRICSILLFLCAGIHLGMHGDSLRATRRRKKPTQNAGRTRRLLRVLLLITALYSMWAEHFFTRFWTAPQPLEAAPLFFWHYGMIFLFFAICGDFFSRRLKNHRRKLPA